MSTPAIDLYEHLPVFYRMRDAEQGYPLRALLDIISAQADVIKRDVDGLWDDFFIETCADWVIPYIGDLVGNNPLYEITQGRRADVAKTIYYRRRKGVLPMLEELARDITGWGAHAVAAFENLGWTQNLNHLRYDVFPDPEKRFPLCVSRVGTVNLRDMNGVNRLDGPFDTISHTVDVRPTDQLVGRYNIRKINFFLWRLQQYPLTAVPAQPAPSYPNGFYFSILGNATPLFTNPEREADPTGLATELHVPGPIRPAAFHFNPGDYYGPDKSFALYEGALATPDTLIPLSRIFCQNLATWRDPPPGKVGIDVGTGRVAFPPGEAPPKLTVFYNYGFSDDLGSGPYSRRKTLHDTPPNGLKLEVAKAKPLKTLQAALTVWEDAGRPPCLIEIGDNQVYGGLLEMALPENGRLIIQAADGLRPTVRPVGQWLVTASDGDADMLLNGLLVEGRLELCGDLNLHIQHCTLVPGRRLNEDGSPRYPDLDSIVLDTPCDQFADLTVTVDNSILGPIRLPAGCAGLAVRDSLIAAPDVAGSEQPAIAANDDADKPGPPTVLERVTLWGQVHVKELTASETIFNDRVRVTRRQSGCLRFCYAPPQSVTPRRYRCQPDLALAQKAAELGYGSVEELPPQHKAPVLAQLRPVFSSVHYGDPAFGQLSQRCAVEIRTGAEDGAEMGAFCRLQQPQRETNLRIRLEEYLPFGLEPGLIVVT